MTDVSWNYAGVFLVVVSIVIAFLWSFDVIEFKRAILAIGILIVFGLVYIGTQCLGIIDELRWRNSRLRGK
jgi:membrane protein YdbS with pleckstrin-like domain